MFHELGNVHAPYFSQNVLLARKYSDAHSFSCSYSESALRIAVAYVEITG